MQEVQDWSLVRELRSHMLCGTAKKQTNKDTINKTKEQHTEWEKIFANGVTDKGIISRIYKQLIQFNIRKSGQKWAEDLKEWNNAICSNTDRSRDCHTEWSKTEEEKCGMTSLIYVESKKKWYKWTYLQNRKRFNEGTYSFRGGRMGKGIVRKFGMDMYTLLYLKWTVSKDLLYSTWNLLNVIWQPGWEGSLGE